MVKEQFECLLFIEDSSEDFIIQNIHQTKNAIFY